LKLTYPICCGIDVHKKFLVATIVTSKGLEPHYQKRRFSTFNGQILALKTWLLENNCRDVCMESTGKYWVPVFNLLEDSINVTIANPKWVRAVCKSSEKNRYQNVFTVCNIALDSVVSDMFGKSSTSILDYILASDTFDPVHCVSLLHSRMKPKADDIVASIEGFQMTDAQKIRARMVKEHYDYLVGHIEKMDAAIDELAKPYESAISLLCTIPGVDHKSAITIISEIGTDVSQFDSSKRLCCWAGLAPGSNESGGKKKSVRISRAGVYLKPMLVQVAHAAVKDKNNPYYRIKYEAIAKRRGKKRAIIAIARMILTAAFQMFKSGEVWNPCDLQQVDMPPELREKQLQKSLRIAAKLLVAHGVVAQDAVVFREQLAA